MARLSRILALDIGAASIKAAEFDYPVGGTAISLEAFDYREYGEELTEENRSIVIAAALRDMLQSNSFTARKTVISISGQFALTRFVKLPPVAEEESRIRQIVEFEARQNVPFPMEEVIWDYQLIANPEAEELEVMFVVIKNEIVEQITNAVQAVGLSPVLVDVAPCACYNAARASGIGGDECAMILNLGARSTNLLFADRQQFFARTIPIAGHSISQQIAKEFGIGMEKAEELKRRHGFVALGGAYAEPESEVAAAVSKIVRNVMTRLHGEINRSIGVYRAQQKGNTPKRLFLTGGSSIMGFTDKFFADKLGIPVEYFNPLQVVQLGPRVDTERLQDVAHMFSEVVGLGLRYRGQCPVEVSLMPASISKQLVMKQRRPYLYACAACLLVILGGAYLAIGQKSELYRRRFDSRENQAKDLELLNKQIESTVRETGATAGKHRFLEGLLAGREQIPALLNEIEGMVPNNLWLVSIKPVAPAAAAGGKGAGGDPRSGGDLRMGGEDYYGEHSEPSFLAMVGGLGGRQPTVQPEAKLEFTPTTISALELRGHSLVLDPGLLAELAAAQAKPVDGAGGPPPEEEEATTPEMPTPLPEELAPVNENAVAPAPAPQAAPESRHQTPEELFLSRLQAADFVDPAGTAIVSYQSHMEVANLKTFTLRVTLRTPLETKYE